MTYFSEILRRALNRRDLFKFVGLSAVLYVVPTYGKSKTLTYKTLYPNSEDRVMVPEGYDYSVLIKWGDPLDNGPALNLSLIHI